MAGSINKVILIGNVGKDPEARRMTSGDMVVSFSVATSESWKDKNTGERRENTSWHNVVIFNEGIAKVAEAYIKKGSKVYVEGALQTRKWQDQSGADKYTTEIVLQKFRGELQLLDSKPTDNKPAPRQDSPQDYAGASGGRLQAELDDDIPFAPEFR